MGATGWTFLVSRADHRRHRVQPAGVPNSELRDGEARLVVERFALTGNNLTYALAGDRLGYWRLFDAPESCGVIPAWGYAVVSESRSEAAPVGTRVFGLVPMATDFRLTPRRTRLGLFDQSDARRGLNPAYNLYAEAPPTPLDDLRAGLRPLAILGFVLAEHLREAEAFGAEAVVVTGASSKTALSLGHGLAGWAGRRRIGLTSAGNRSFCEETGCYDQVIAYHAPGAAVAGAWVLVDFSGDAGLVEAIIRQAGRPPVRTILVGQLHARDPAAAPPEGDFFFAPDHIQARIAAWGGAAFERRFEDGFAAFLEACAPWIAVTRGYGPTALAAAYERLLSGHADSREVMILAPAPA